MKNTEIVFGIYGGNAEGKDFHAKCLLGTAFYIGGDIFMTAGHVLKQAENYDLVTIAVKGKSVEKKVGSLAFAGVGKHEIFEKTDIGLIRSLVNNHQDMQIPLWSSENLYPLDDVHTMGFPFGLDVPNNGVYLRALKGYIVSSYQFDIPNYGKANCYELSIHCPRGLSGAPLLSNAEPGGLFGVIIGNSSSELEIYYEQKEDKEANTINTYHKTETTKYGIAIDAREIFPIYSDMLGKTIEEHLKEYNCFMI